MKKHLDVPPLVSTSVRVHCQTLVSKINPTHVLIVKGHREGFLDSDHRFFLLDPSVGNIFRGLASTGRDHVDDCTVEPTRDSDVCIIADNRATFLSVVFHS